MDQLISVKRGDTYERTIRIKINGVLQDITGWKFIFVAKNDPSDTDAAAVIKVEWTDHSDPGNGETLLELTSDNTDKAPKDYFAAIRIIAPSMVKTKIGTMVIEQSGVEATS